jgi:hypothetical protein
MKYYLFSDKIDYKSFQGFKNWFHEVEGEVTIFLQSPGGYYTEMDAIRTIINDNADRVKLIATSSIESAAFELFFTVNCRRELRGGTWGMYHLPRITVPYMVNGKLSSDDSFGSILATTKQELQSVKRFISTLGLSRSEKKRLLKGEDVYFDYKRLKKMFERHCKKYGKNNNSLQTG